MNSTGLCYHCDNSIYEGDEAIVLPTGERMHKSCAIVRQVTGNMALSGFELTGEDEERIRYLIEHPDEYDKMLEALIQKHKQSQ